MTEEEKEAIENIKALKILFEIDDKKDFEATPLVQKEMAKDLRTLLNLIEKLQKETTKYKNMYESEHKIHLLRNEQLDRKQNAITKCNELQTENEQLRTEMNSLQKENEELNKNYNFLIDKIILKIDEYDYKFKKAKKQNKNDIADYYWDLIINFTKLLGGE